MTFGIKANLTLAACCILALHGCERAGQSPPASSTDNVASSLRVIEYEWFNEGTPAGEQTVTVSSDKDIVSDMRIRWNNRDFILHNEMKLDENGFVVSQELSGTSAFGAPINETFELTGNTAKWRSTFEEGNVQITEPTFYLPGRTGATESIAALFRAALDNPDRKISLLPSGVAEVRKLTEIQLKDTGKSKRVALYSAVGLRFAPTYAWFDCDMNLFSFGFWGLSMAPKGYGYDTHEQLKAAESQYVRTHYENLSDTLGEVIDGPLLIENVAVLDVESGTLMSNHYILAEQGKLTRISAVPIQVDHAHRVDGTGKTLIPGLWDMHAHTDFFSYHGGILNIAGGVTSVRDMGSDHAAMIEASEHYASGELIGPRVYRAGFIDKTSPYSGSRAVDSLDEAKSKVEWYADNGYIQIKLYSSIAPEWVRPLTDLAHSRGLRVSGHVPAFMTAEHAVRDGFDEIQHVNMLFLNFLAGETDDTRTQLRFYLYGDEAGNLDLGSEAVSDFVELLAEKNIVVDPTVAVFDSMIGHRAGEPDPMFAAIIDHMPIGEYRSMHSPALNITEENVEAWNRSRQKALEMIGKLYEGGVQIVAGTDALPGFALHRELELYAAAGIPNAAVLKIATIDAARVSGADTFSGSISVGKQADIVLLDGNPLDDISSIRRAVLVVKGEMLYRPDELMTALGIQPIVQSN